MSVKTEIVSVEILGAGTFKRGVTLELHTEKDGTKRIITVTVPLESESDSIAELHRIALDSVKEAIQKIA